MFPLLAMKNAKARKSQLRRKVAPAAAEPRKKLVGITEDTARLFLDALAGGFSVEAACKKSGVARATAYDLRRADKTFREQWIEAVEKGTDLLEDEALRRAVAGTTRQIFQQGKLVGQERVYSDRLLEILLRARRPAKFREKVAHEHSGKDGGPIPFLNIKNLNNEQLAQLKARLLAGATGATPQPGRSETPSGD